jgi:hypothetical protein
MSDRNLEKTQNYSSWGDKLLQHTDVLYGIQNDHKIAPITIQLAPCEICDSDCPFCSVAARPLKSYMSFDQIVEMLNQFRLMGAKSLEITGGGNPLLYRDRVVNKNINDVIRVASDLGFSVGIITNTENLGRHLDPSVYDMINWIRISLIKLDEGVDPEDYDFAGFPEEKMGFSYIIYDGTGGVPDELSRTNKPYQGTTSQSIERIAKLVELHDSIKFVRIAGNCLIKGNNASVRDQYADVLAALDQHDKFFIKDIGEDDGPFDDGCYIGGIRPYIAPHPEGGDYQVYICTSHVLNQRLYDLNYSLGSVTEIVEIWEKMCRNLYEGLPLYQVGDSASDGWCSTCKYCYYKFNNKLLHTVVNEMPDKDFA